MKVWYLDNEHSDYVILAESADEAWLKLKDQHWILRPDADVTGDYSAAYNDLYEVPPGHKVDNPHDLTFVL